MGRHMRLRREEDFARLRREGRAYHHRLLTLSLAPNGLPHNRYGFITSKRLGKAVARNRVRRLLREVMRELHPQLEAGFDILVIARPPLVGQPLTSIVRILQQLTRQARIVVERGQ